MHTLVYEGENRQHEAGLDADAASAEIAGLCASVDAAMQRLLIRVREFDESEEWFRQGAVSCAQWLGWRVGLSLREARELVVTARRLGALPAVDAALSRGEISYCKARAIAGVATSERESVLLEMARNSTGPQLDRICNKYRQLLEREGRRPDEEDSMRFVSFQPADNGMTRLVAQLLPEEAAIVSKAIDAAARVASGQHESVSEAGVDEGALQFRPVTRIDRADGLVALAEAAAVCTSPRGAIRSPVEVVLTTSVASLGLGPLDRTHAMEDCEMPAMVEGDIAVPPSVARRLSCDSSVSRATVAGGEPLDIGRRRRTIPAALRRALRVRDDGCRFPGCHNRRFVDGHHIEHWADGGETKLDNLIELCRRHHRFVHEFGYRIERRDGELVFVDSRGGSGLGYGIPPPVAELEQFSAEVNYPAWDGTSVDYAACVDGLESSRGPPTPQRFL